MIAHAIIAIAAIIIGPHEDNRQHVLEYLGIAEAPVAATSTSANLKPIADKINGGDARIMVFSDSQMGPPSIDRMVSAMRQMFQPTQGWSGHSQPYGPGPTLTSTGSWYQFTSPIATDVANLSVTSLGPGDATDDPLTNIVIQILDAEFVFSGAGTADTEFSQGGFWHGINPTWAYGGAESHWSADYNINHSILFYTGDVPGSDLQIRGSRFSQSSGSKGHGSYSAMGVTGLGYGVKTIPIPITEGGITGAPIVTIKTGAGTTVTGDQVLIQSQIMAADDGSDRATAFGMKEGLAFCGFVGTGGEDMVNHLDATRYGDASLEALITNSYTPNIVVLWVTNLDATEVSGSDIVPATYNANVESMITRVKARYSALSLPAPMFLLVQPWAGHPDVAMNVTRAAQTEIELFDVADSTPRSQHSFINMFTLAGRIHNTDLVQPASVHPIGEGQANELASRMWSVIAAEADTGLLNGLVAYWKLNEALESDTHIDEMGFHHLEQGSGSHGVGPDPTAGKIAGEGGLLYLNDAKIRFSALNGSAPNHGSYLQPLPAGDFSCQWWWKADSTAGGEVQAFMVGDNTAAKSFRLGYFHTDRKLRMVVNGTSWTVNHTLADASVIEAGETWFHFVFVHRHGVGQTMYIDGVEFVNPSPMTAQIQTADTKFSLGGQTSTDMQGVLAHPAIWQRALTSTEVTELWNDGDGLPLSMFSPVSGQRPRDRSRNR